MTRKLANFVKFHLIYYSTLLLQYAFFTSTFFVRELFMSLRGEQISLAEKTRRKVTSGK